MTVTGRKAAFNLIPRDVYLKQLAPYLGDFVALDLWEMFNAFADLGFAAAGDPENLKNTEEVHPFSSVTKQCSLASISILGLTT